MRLLAKRLIKKRLSYIKTQSIGLWYGKIDYLPTDHWMHKRFRYQGVLRYFSGDVSQCRCINNEYRNF